MNNYYLILKGINKKFASLEFEILWKTYFDEEIKLEEIENVLYKFSSDILIDKKHPMLKRLTFTNYLGLELFNSDDEKEFTKKIEEYDFSGIEGKSFAIRSKKSKKELKNLFEDKEIAKNIWYKLKNPKVNLKNPDIEFNYIINEKIGILGLAEKIYENEKEYLGRMPKFRPVAKPYTLKSDMARASLNLLDLKKGVILDPFCGIGGILLEAHDMGFTVIGNDISWNDLRDMKKNFEYYFPKGTFYRTLADSKTQFLKKNTIDGIVTDIPYGKCSRRLGIDLYEKFLISAKEYLKPNAKMIVIYANFVEFKDIALKYFKEVDEIDEYINKGMTRHILILKNNK